MIFLVLGMHKSGTTLVARLLHGSGIHMGVFDASMHYDQGNHYEREETLALNRRILGDDNLESIDESKLDRVQEVDRETLGGMRELVEKNTSEHVDWGFKDPRTCLTYDLWAQVLPKHKLVFVFRHPAEACDHYLRRRRTWQVFDRFRRARRVVRTWCNYNSAALASISRSRMEALVLSYSELMESDESIRRLSEFADHPIQDLRDLRLYRASRRPTLEYLVARHWCRLVDNVDSEEVYHKLVELGYRTASAERMASAGSGP